MGESFAPFIKDVFPIMVELSNFNLSSTIRKNALKSFRAILRATGCPANLQAFAEIKTLLM